MRKKKIIIISFSFLLLLSSFLFLPTNKAGDYDDQKWFRRYYICTNSQIETANGGGDCTRVKTQGWLITPNGTICNFMIGNFVGGTQYIFLSKSFDNGSTWTNPVKFIDSCYNGSWSVFATLTINDYHNVFPNRRYLNAFPQGSNKGCNYLIWTDDNASTWHGLTGTEIDEEAIDIHEKVGWSKSFPANYWKWCVGTGVIHSSGRIIIPAVFRNGTDISNIWSVYSDDVENGNLSSWNVTAEYGSASEYSENSIVELKNGSLYNVIRDDQGETPAHTHLYYSRTTTDAGKGNSIVWKESSNDFPYWSQFNHCEEYCDVIRLTDDTTYNDSRILMVWNNYTWQGTASASRRYLTVACSKDETLSWAYDRQITGDEYTDYPMITVAPNNTILVGYKNHSVSELQNWVFQFNIEWLSNGEDTLELRQEEIEIEFEGVGGLPDDSFISTRKPSITWSKVDNAIQYHLQIATDIDFNNLVVNIDDINTINYPNQCSTNDTSVTFKLINDLESVKHYMRVRALI